MSKADEYIELYKKLERITKREYGLGDSDKITGHLIRDRRFGRFTDNIDYCRRVRNLMSHEEKVDKQFLVDPSDAMIEFISKLIIELENRKKCHQIAVNLKSLYHGSMEDNVSEAMQIMRKENYTHIPILKDGQVVGVFDENAIFNYLADNIVVAVDELTFKDLEEYLSVDDRELITFEFVKSDSYVEDLIKKFDVNNSLDKRIGMVFLTPGGTRNEKITGIITTWDILGSTEI